MKTLFLKLSILILITGLSFNAFTQTINIDSTFYSDTEIYPFSGVDSIYGLSISGNITLDSDTSLVRIILVDENYNEYMVYEAYPLITTSLDFNIADICDETCYLNGTTPVSLFIYVNHGSINLESLTYSTIFINNAEALSYQAKLQNDSIKVQNMNINIQNRGWNWIAGHTQIVQMNYEEKSNIYGANYNMQGFEYYLSGVYRYISQYQQMRSASTLVESFDWRERHGANIDETGNVYFGGTTGWLTPLRYQGTCGACTAFGTTAMVEAMTNLYFNNQFVFGTNEEELDLAEMDVWCGCNGVCANGIHPNTALNYIKNNGIVNEDCYPYDPPCSSSPPPCTNPEIKITFDYYLNVNNSSFDNIKSHLIEYGPLAQWIYLNQNFNHEMLLIGYRFDSETNETIWIYKDSYNNYREMVLPSTNVIEKTQGILQGPNWGVHQLIGDDFERNCRDFDNDGYYYWGVGYRMEGCGDENTPQDSDDSEPRIGPFDKNYYGIPVRPEMLVMCERVIDDDGFFTFHETSQSRVFIFTIKNEGNAQLNFYSELFGPPSDLIESSNPSVFEIELTNPVPYISMNSGETTFQITYHYTSGPGNDNAVITINTLELDIESFNFFIENTDCEFNTEVEEINHVVNWQDWAIKSSNVLVKDGAELNITGHYGFVKDASLIIEAGGKVTIDGGVLTKACLNKWQGVDVWGNSNLSQYPTSNQGYIKIINNGSIRNAETGIQAAQIINGLYVSGTTGGIISCNDAIFKDNISDIIIYPFENTHPVTGEKFHNFCSFTNTQFINTTVCEHDPYVNLWRVDGIKFRGCSFINKLTKSDCPFGYYKGIGIMSFSSGFYVDDYCISNIVPCNETKQCHFENLEYGIYAFNGELSKYILIDNAVFVNNKTGIYMSMVENQTITQNKFIYDDTHDLLNDTPVGLYLETCTGYSIEENIFSSDVQDITIMGIQILNSGSAYNEIYNNTFENLNTGISAAGENRDATGNGLCIKCNDFEECTDDIYITNQGCQSNPGIAFSQGDFSSVLNPDNTLAAGNSFSDFSGMNYNYTNKELCGQIQYVYHGNNMLPDLYKLIPDPTYPLQPNSHILLDPDNNADYISKQHACPSNFNSTIDYIAEKSIISSESAIVSLYENTLTQLVDGGDTEELNLDVQLSNPSESLVIRQQLLDESPYLSDTVMKSAIEKENVLPNAMIRDVLVANPQSAKSASVINSLDDRIIPVPEYMINQIMQGDSVFSAKELLEQNLSNHNALRDKSLNRVLRGWFSDTVNINQSYDSIVSVLSGLNKLSAKYNLSLLYLNKGDSINAFSEYENIENDFELDNYQMDVNEQYGDLLEIIWHINNNTITVLDSASIEILTSIIDNDNNSKPEFYSRNILINEGLILYNEQLYFPDIYKVTPIWSSGGRNTLTPEVLKVFPNPTKNYFIAEFEFSNEVANPMLIVSTIKGHDIMKISLNNSNDQLVVPVNGLPTGLYIVKIIGNKKVLGSKKLTILK